MRTGRLLTLALALGALAELSLWLYATVDTTAAFGLLRARTHVREAGVGWLLVGAGAGALLLPTLRGRRGLWLLAAAALVVHLPLLDVAQAQPDTARWFVLAQGVAADPVGAIAGWPARFAAADGVARNQLYPLVPFVYGLLFRLFGESSRVGDGGMTLFGVLLPLGLAWAGAGAADLPRPVARRVGLVAGWGLLATPFLVAQGGWLLADLPLCAALALGFGAMLRARTPTGWALVALACVPALITKVGGGLFLAGALGGVVLHRRPRSVLLIGAFGYALLYMAKPFRFVEPGIYLATLVGLLVHLRVALLLPALVAAFVPRRHGGLAGTRIGGLVLGVSLTLPALLLYTPAHHVPRYALPVVLAAALGVAALGAAAPDRGRRGRWVGGLIGVGLALYACAYLPIVRHTQGVNLQEGARRLVAEGATAIEVWSDQPDSPFPSGPIAALVDYYVEVPVRLGGTVAISEADKNTQWWDRWEVPPWHAPGPADAALVALYGSRPDRFESLQYGWERITTISRYQASSWLLPKEVAIYRKAAPARSEGEPLHADETALPPARFQE